MNLDRLKMQLIEDEGIRLFPYRDTVGKLTIGVGRNLDDVGISKNEAIALLTNDISKVMTQLMMKIPWYMNMNQPRQEVIINMAFNMGMQGILGFKNMLQAAKESRWDDAAKEMLDSKWAQQVGKRAQRLAMVVKTGVA